MSTNKSYANNMKRIKRTKVARPLNTLTTIIYKPSSFLIKIETGFITHQRSLIHLAEIEAVRMPVGSMRCFSSLVRTKERGCKVFTSINNHSIVLSFCRPHSPFRVMRVNSYLSPFRVMRVNSYLFLMIILLVSSVAVMEAVIIADYSLSNLPTTQGFTMTAGGNAVSSAGDVNGDGVGDIIIGSSWANSNNGATYVIFGKKNTVISNFALTGFVTGATTGFRILPASAVDYNGFSVSKAGDVNNDGVDDVITSSWGADLSGRSDAGISYVIFGRKVTVAAGNAFADIPLPNGPLAANIGFRILGSATNDHSGEFVSSAGDMNGDGIDDIIVGAATADSPNFGTDNNAGIAYVIFGRNITSGAAAFGDIDLQSITTGNSAGFRIIGAASGDHMCRSTSRAAGDVNGDGISDVIIGDVLADSPGLGTNNNGGISYVIFGRKVTAPADSFGDIQLPTSTMAPTIGFRILGAGADHHSGATVSAGGDVNGDGIDDITIGADLADPPGFSGDSNGGIVYVIYGRNIPGGATPFTDIYLSNVVTGTTIGFRVLGAEINSGLGLAVAITDDINGDGIDDLVLGARYTLSTAGTCYVLFGRKANVGNPFADVYLSTMTSGSAMGFRVFGASSSDQSGSIVNSAGDVNGDSVPDIIIGSPAGSSYVIYGTPATPTSQPSSQPSRQPSRQPSHQPSALPSRQPSAQPSSQPSTQPTRQPISQPSRQPSAHPSSQPSKQPSRQPTAQPSCQPTGQPSSQPAAHPSTQPTQQPTKAPTKQPSSQPSKQPSAKPSAQPSSQPSSGPTRQPTLQPSMQPTHAPSVQPSSQPSAGPSHQRTKQPTRQPSSQPTVQPSALPSMQPINDPSSQPSSPPSAQPSTQPSAAPSAQPTQQPSDQPSKQPSAHPTVQPSSQLTAEPTIQPTSRPSTQPSVAPSVQPTAQPTKIPSSPPTSAPSEQPSVSPSSQPTTMPSHQPSSCPSVQPSTQPSAQPSRQPSQFPSTQQTTAPSVLPSLQPSEQPTLQPSVTPSNQPSCRPTYQPSVQPSLQPYAIPTSQPTTSPTASPTPDSQITSWMTPIYNNLTVNTMGLINNDIWVCGEKNHSASCTTLDSTSGVVGLSYRFPWIDAIKAIQTSDLNRIVIRGQTVATQGTINSEVASCYKEQSLQLNCVAKTFYETEYTAATFVPFPNKLLFIGVWNAHVIVSIIDVATPSDSFPGQKHFTYMFKSMQTVTIAHLHSPPVFIGGFFAGTGVSTGSLNSIVVGVVRTDSGGMGTVYCTPSSGTILNSVDLVNAMTLEYEHPDTFIAGGLQLSDGAGIHSYLLRVNAFFGSVKYFVRYRVYLNGYSDSSEGGNRRALSEPVTTYTSVTRCMVKVESAIYMIVGVNQRRNQTCPSLTVLKADIATGLILQQVHVSSPSACISCTDITASSDNSYLYLACSVQADASRTEAVVIATDTMLQFPKLPVRFTQHTQSVFMEEMVPFRSFPLPVTSKRTDLLSQDYAFSTADGTPTLRPSTVPTRPPSPQPSSAPSGQPSSSPTSAPSVSPQPTSQPSSSGPTNTYKPTVKPTQRPTRVPSATPTASPSEQPTIIPTARLSTKPSPVPSNQPSATRTTAPTRPPTAKPTTKPSSLPSAKPTQNLTSLSSAADVVTATVGSSSYNADDPVMIFLYVFAGLIGVWCVYQSLQCCARAQHDKAKRKAIRAELEHIELVPLLLPPYFDNKVRTRQLGAYADGAAIAAGGELTAELPRGAYAIGKPVIPVAVGSDTSSSVVVSSLHSSEMSDISYSVYSGESNSEEYNFRSEQTKSKDSMMEEGGSGDGSADTNFSGLSNNSTGFIESCSNSSGGTLENESTGSYLDDAVSVIL